MRLPLPTKKPREENLIPLINVVFLMLIFFLVAASLRQFQARGVKPVIADDMATSESTHKPLLINADGKITLDGDLIDEQDLKKTLLQMAGRQSLATVFIVADRNLPASMFVDVLQAAKSAGVKNIRLVAQRRRE